MAWREECRERRKDVILEAAAAAFAEKGYQRATMKEVAAHARIAPGTIYLYFKNKRDLMLTIADHLLSESLHRQLGSLADIGEEVLLERLLHERFQFARENRPFIQALATAVWTDEEVRERFFAGILGPIFATLEEYLRTRVEGGRLRPCRAEVVIPAMAGAFFFFGILRSLTPTAFTSDLSDQEVIEELARLYLYGLRPRAEEEAE